VTKPKTDASLPQLLTLPEVTVVLNLSLKTLRRRIDAGALTVIRDGRILRVHPNDVERYIASRRGL
jgi:excisionase family DNA binding protein